MRTILVISLLAATVAPTDAGVERVFGGPHFDRGVLAQPTADGGYIAVGVTASFGAGGEDVYLVKTDGDGELLWSQTYGGPDDDNGWSVLETDDGFVIAGFTKSFGDGGYDFYLIRTDEAGDEQWSRTYGGAADDRCWAVAAADDGGFVLVGETASSGAGERDCLLVAVDASGEELFSETYGGEKDDRCFDVVRADDGGYVFAGQTYSEGAGDRDAYVIKTASDGERSWSKTFGGPASDVGHSVTRTSDGRFVVTGYTTSFATAGDDPYLIKLDALGEEAWTRVLPIDGVHHTLTGDEAADGGFFLVGFSVLPGSRAKSALVVRTEPDGELRWHRNVLATDAGESFGYTVRSTPDGGCVFAGHTSVGSAGNMDLLLVTIDDEAPPLPAVAPR